MIKKLFIGLLSLTAVSFAGSAFAAPTFVTIGTGGITGVYYPTGGAIAKIINENRDKYNIRASVESTGASVFNINAIMTGDLDFGIAQADRQYQAYNGLSEWEGRPQKNLRAVFALAPEMVTFIAAEDANIKSLADAKGKVINIGNPGSGNRQNALDVFEAVGLSTNDFNAESIKAADAPRMLQDGRIDGFFYTVAHPNGNIKEATSGNRKTRIVPIADATALTEKFPYYTINEIDMTQYQDATNASEGKVPTVSMLATFVTNANTPDEVVYAITKEVFENLDEFKTLHPALNGLTKEGMLQGLTAPLHPGAEKYYKEVGLIQ